jgi:hypothetical protein
MINSNIVEQPSRGTRSRRTVATSEKREKSLKARCMSSIRPLKACYPLSGLAVVVLDPHFST